MEAEIDLRPFFLGLIRRWRLLAALCGLFVLVAVALAFLLPRTPSATASVLLVANTTQLTFDPRFVTSDGATLNNSAAQREALVALATSPSLESSLRAQLPAELLAEVPRTGDLARQMKVVTKGDLLQITAGAASEEQAQLLAETWARGYAQFVNTVYSGSGQIVDLDAQVAQAQARYEKAQQDLEAFLRDSQMVHIEQQIQEMQGLLDEARKANQENYAQYLLRAQTVDLIVGDARTLRAQLAAGSVSTFATSLADLMLRARASGDANLPLDLTLTDQQALGAEVSVANIDAFIAILEQRRADLLQQAEQFANAVADNTTGTTLSSERRQQYEQTLQQLREQNEQQSGQQRLLIQQRDVAFSSLEVLQRKRDEQRVSSTIPTVTARFVSTTLDIPRSRLLNAALAGTVGLILGLFTTIMLVLFVDIIRPQLRASLSARESAASLAPDLPADRAATS